MKGLKLIVVLVGIMSLILSQVSWAEEKDEGVFKLEEIVVTATKTERKLKDISTDITVITEEDIEKYEPRKLADLLRQVPGLNLMQGPSGYFVGSRGNAPGAKGIVFMMDGIEMNTPTNWLNMDQIPVNNIERIEIVKTPSSAMYGPIGVGGIINVITKKPEKKFESKVSATYGSYDRKESTVNFGGLLDNGFTYGLNYWYLDRDGYRHRDWFQQHIITPV